MGSDKKVFLLLLHGLCLVNAGVVVGKDGSSLYLQPIEKRFAPSWTQESKGPVKSPRGFSDFVTDQDLYGSGVDEQDNGLPQDGRGSTYNGNAWRREDELTADVSRFDNYNQNYARMMMMQAMRRMDSSRQKPGILSRILDNPATLVMATVIPLSLIVAVNLPLLVNVMMNGVTIPPLIPTTASKARSVDLAADVDLLPIFDSLADLGLKYLENPGCTQRAFCLAATKNSTLMSHPNYIHRAVEMAQSISNKELLDSFGVKALIMAIRHNKCDDLPCSKMKDGPALSQVMDSVMFSHSVKKMPMNA